MFILSNRILLSLLWNWKKYNVTFVDFSLLNLYIIKHTHWNIIHPRFLSSFYTIVKLDTCALYNADKFWVYACVKSSTKIELLFHFCWKWFYCDHFTFVYIAFSKVMLFLWNSKCKIVLLKLESNKSVKFFDNTSKLSYNNLILLL